ncbi:MAG TPA: gluconokinase [Caulobacteraceae bacterium]|jgi:carbohydrate kinase (thermoresistant glucokinase family)|nr:gluconokinase [Caulobacteraceae bacterium]
MTGPPLVAAVMGVSGVGKTTVGTALARRLGWSFQEGDALHPAANVAKMGAGLPLTDDDRAPWLGRVKAWIDARLDERQAGVITCSALKRSYRDLIRAGRPGVVLVFITADRNLIAGRLGERHGHFMPPALLPSQFAALEPPAPDEHPITVSADEPLDEQVMRIEKALAARPA